MREQKADVVRRAVEEIWNRGELDVADDLFSDEYVNHGGLVTDLVCGPESIKASASLFRTAFPALHIRIESLRSDGDTVDLHWAADSGGNRTGTIADQGGSRRGLTGRTISTIIDRRIVESWTSWDQAGALQRLTITPPECEA